MSARAISRILFSAAVIAPETDLKCCKRTELPLYTQDKLPTECAPKAKHHVEKSGVIEETIRTIRLNIDSVFNEVKKYEDMTRSHLQEGVDNAQWLVDYLGDEENQAPKAPAIAIGGLTGFIFGLRGGFFKKVIYTSVGALGMAAVCYPKEAREYGGLALDEGHRYATIAYNFAYGDKSQKLSAEASDPKKVSADDPCKWLDNQKSSGGYQRVVRAEELRKRVEAGEDVSPAEAQQRNIEYYEGDETCPCHLGSCMHARSKDDCPEELPYPPPNCPRPEDLPSANLQANNGDCACGPCCPPKAAKSGK